jgi:hypothetical protein
MPYNRIIMEEAIIHATMDENLIVIMDEVMLMLKKPMMIEHKHSGKRAKVESSEESYRMPPPPWCGLNPTRAPIIIIVVIIDRAVAAGRSRIRLRRIFRLAWSSLRRRLLRFALSKISLFGRVIRLRKNGTRAKTCAKCDQATLRVVGDLRFVRLEIVPGKDLTCCPLNELTLGRSLSRQNNRRKSSRHITTPGVDVPDYTPGKTIVCVESRERFGLVIGQLRQTQVHHPRHIRFVKFRVVAVDRESIGKCRHRRRRIRSLLDRMNCPLLQRLGPPLPQPSPRHPEIPELLWTKFSYARISLKSPSIPNKSIRPFPECAIRGGNDFKRIPSWSNSSNQQSSKIVSPGRLPFQMAFEQLRKGRFSEPRKCSELRLLNLSYLQNPNSCPLRGGNAAEAVAVDQGEAEVLEVECSMLSFISLLSLRPDVQNRSCSFPLVPLFSHRRF